MLRVTLSSHSVAVGMFQDFQVLCHEGGKEFASKYVAGQLPLDWYNDLLDLCCSECIWTYCEEVLAVNDGQVVAQPCSFQWCFRLRLEGIGYMQAWLGIVASYKSGTIAPVHSLRSHQYICKVIVLLSFWPISVHKARDRRTNPEL